MDRRQFLNRTSMALMGSTFAGCLPNKSPLLKKGQTIGCLGDSITFGNGKGYVELLQKHFETNRPEMDLRFLNWGKSSETVTGLTEENHPGPRPYLFERLDSLLEQTPIAVATFCYGINCGIYGKPSPGLFDSFKIGIYSFLEKMAQKNIGAILLTPPPLVLDTVPVKASSTLESYGYLNPYPQYEQEVLLEFVKIVSKVRHRALLGTIDIHTPLHAQRQHCYEEDPIHPNQKGHRLIARTIIENLGI